MLIYALTYQMLNMAKWILERLLVALSLVPDDQVWKLPDNEKQYCYDRKLE